MKKDNKIRQIFLDMDAFLSDFHYKISITKSIKLSNFFRLSNIIISL